MAASKPLCTRMDCFQNKCGVYCDLLTERPTEPCAFYKTDAQVENGRIEAHNRLLEMGRQDLIKKYEYNPQRRGQW